MAAVVMDGKALAAKIREQVRLQVEQMERKPGMAMVLVGEDPAAQVYEAGKRKDCQQCGIYYETYRLPEDVPQRELLDGPSSWPSGRTRMWTASTPPTWGT